MAIDRAFCTPTMTIDQSRYEELIRAELKCEQYKTELEKQGNFDIVNIIEAQKLEVCKKEESEEITL